ncbi:MAG: hypothetical protein R3344_10440, partial [Acidobacteriota bacterium]|nr:hypothetical protein [Acidobacteriota bacterium]
MMWFVVAGSVSAEELPDLVAIDASQIELVRALDLPVVWKGPRFLVARWDAETRETARSAGVGFEIVAREVPSQRVFYLIELRDRERGVLPPGTVLYHRGHHVVMQMDPEEATAWSSEGH